MKNPSSNLATLSLNPALAFDAEAVKLSRAANIRYHLQEEK